MQTTGACQVGTDSPGSQRGLQPFMRVVVRPRCCAFLLYYVSCQPSSLLVRLTMNTNSEEGSWSEGRR
jgi:hypothetical protein